MPTSSTPAGELTGSAAEPGHDEEKHAAQATDREAVDPDGVVRRGKVLSTSSETFTVTAATENAIALSGKTVKLTGKVSSVCQKMGCWFVLAGDKPEHSVRISSRGHNIYVPRSSVGLLATVEGEISVKTLDVKTAQHFEDERELKPGEVRRTITKDTQELSIAVEGLEMRRAPAG